VVCAPPESERYRIPEKLRSGGSLQSRQAWANRAIAFETYGRPGSTAARRSARAAHRLQPAVDQPGVQEREEEAAGATPPAE
jgi:hypothetical protein